MSNAIPKCAEEKSPHFNSHFTHTFLIKPHSIPHHKRFLLLRYISFKSFPHIHLPGFTNTTEKTHLASIYQDPPPFQRLPPVVNPHPPGPHRCDAPVERTSPGHHVKQKMLSAADQDASTYISDKMRQNQLSPSPAIQANLVQCGQDGGGVK